MYVLEEGRVRFIPPVIEPGMVEDRGYLNFEPSLLDIEGEIEHLNVSVSEQYHCNCSGDLETSCYKDHVYYSSHSFVNHMIDGVWVCPNCNKKVEGESGKIFECYCGALLQCWNPDMNMWC